MSARPGAQTVEYRGNYDGTGWRWYRISWDSLLDSQGNVRRLAGKAEDVTRQQAEAQRLRDLAAHYRSHSARSSSVSGTRRGTGVGRSCESSATRVK